MSKEYEALKCEACGANLPEDLVCGYCRTVHINKIRGWDYGGPVAAPVLPMVAVSTGVDDLYCST